MLRWSSQLSTLTGSRASVMRRTTALSAALLPSRLPPAMTFSSFARRSYSGRGRAGGGQGQGRQGFRVPPSFYVWAIIAANVGVFGYYHLAIEDWREERKFLRKWLLSKSRFARDPWCLVRSTFTHIGFTHLLFNMFTLHSFGISLVHLIGPSRFLGLYFASGVVGGYLQLRYEDIALRFGFPAVYARPGMLLSDTPSLGASGAVFGLIGAMATIFPKGEMALFFIPMPNLVFLGLVGVGSAYLSYAGDTAFGGAMSEGGHWSLGHFAHLGGLGTGVVAGLVFRRQLFRKWGHRY